MLREAGELQELADPDRVTGKGDVKYWGAGHLAILPGTEGPEALARTVTNSASTPTAA
jgi:hypothetical protein